MNILTNKEKKEKIDLFVECFGDDESFARKLFDCSDVITVTEYVEDKLAVMASLIPTMALDKRGFYVYGVCVDKEFRGMGLFKKIMKRVEDFARKDGADFICLIPASRGLFDTYRRMGFEYKISPYCKGKRGNVLLRSAEFKEIIDTSDQGKDNSGMSGLLKCIDGVPCFNEKLIFDHPMGDV